MIAAIYARKSTDQAVGNEQKSVARQVEHARVFAARHGWPVDEASVFIDDGISGAEFAARPSYMRMMALLQPRPPFDVLIMSESSRLGREAWETGFALKQLLMAGVRVFFYLENRECTFDHPLDKLQFSIVQAFDEMERTRAGQRSTDKYLQLLRAGHVTGGRVFGYDNVRVDSHTERRINEREAAVVRAIFQMAADGIGQKRIAQQLNAERAPSPRAQRGRPDSWAASSVHEALFRDLYRGEIVSNRTRKRDRWGQKRTTPRPADQWVRVPVPELRIVSNELWSAAHDRIAAARVLHQVGTHQAKPGRPKTTEPRYLLTGFARCSCCGGGMHVRSTHHGSPGNRSRAHFYACTTHYTRGVDVCGNDLRVRIEQVDHEVMARVDNLLTPEIAKEVIARVRQLLEPHQVDQRATVVSELEALERQATHLAAAVAHGGNIPALVSQLQRVEQRRLALLSARDSTPTDLPLSRVDWSALEREARQKLASWRALLTRNVSQGRQLLAMVLDGPLVMTPFTDGKVSGYRFRGEAAIGRLLGGVVHVLNDLCHRGSTAARMASPPGFEPGFQP